MAQAMHDYYRECDILYRTREKKYACKVTGRECADGDCRQCIFALKAFNEGVKGVEYK